ncbi:glycosyl transferase [Cryobacterium arcticum]|uniref:D-inositol 3-phosphate glycosyltransferase n=2 Tax=Cryobacterium arcticum TaxID=670052 RepID=A0A1B1BMM5_9MICO|nr:glycosyl transferase [Cryobacterium arcticum]
MSGVIVHEWLATNGGSENVVEVLASIYPDAPIVSLWEDLPSRFRSGRVTETWLSKTPLRHHKALALPLMPLVWRDLPRIEADWVLCSSHLFAHHARFRKQPEGMRKFVYVHTPARYIWTPELDGRGNGIVARALSRPLKALDRGRAQEATSIAANSMFIQKRISEAWGRDSTVIYPPVNVADFAADPSELLTDEEHEVLKALPTTFILGASRFVPYKRLEDAIAAGWAADLPVVLAGAGPDEQRLRAVAGRRPGTVTFVARPSSAMLNELFRRALVYVFPPVEDFGIMPVEVMATGTPVVANAIGGAAESVLHGVTGALVQSFDSTSLKEAVEIAASAKAQDCIERAWQFDVGVFEDRIREWVGE